MKLGPYNGYSGDEREAKFKAAKARAKEGLSAFPSGLCDICADPTAAVEGHTEDYSRPYLWDRPAEYPLCKFCHVSRVHLRFSKPDIWETYKAHIRRGGYSSEVKDLTVQAELAAYRAAVRAERERPVLRSLRERRLTGQEWWETLSTDEATRSDPKARPRP